MLRTNVEPTQSYFRIWSILHTMHDSLHSLVYTIFCARVSSTEVRPAHAGKNDHDTYETGNLLDETSHNSLNQL